METYKTIGYNYNSRTKRYLIITEKSNAIQIAMKKMLGNSAGRMLFIKPNSTSFEFYDFFLLELHYCLNLMKTTEHLLAIDIGGVVLTDLIDFLETRTWLSSRNPKNIVKLFDFKHLEKNMRFMPIEHQVGAFEKYERIKALSNLKGFLMDMSPGSGKTYTSLAMSELLDYDLTIIIAPKSTIVDPWVNSVTTTLFKTPQTYTVFDHKHSEYNNEKFIVTHYEYIPKLMLDKRLARRMKRLKPCLIIDEFHNFNDVTSDRTIGLLNFIHYLKTTDILLLTGTPVKYKLSEVKPMLFLLDDKFPKVVDIFDKFYSNINGIKRDMWHERFNLYRERIENKSESMGDIEILEYKVSLVDYEQYTLNSIKNAMLEYRHTRLPELLNKMDEYKVQFDNLLTLANKNSKVSLLAIIKTYKGYVSLIRDKSDNGKLYEVYDIVNEAKIIEKENILPNLNGLDKKNFRELSSIIKYPKLKVLGESLGKVLLGTRIKCYTELSNNIDYANLVELTNKKTLIFSNYISVCDNVIKHCDKLGLQPLGVYGEHVKNLPTIVKKFNNLEDPSKVLAASYKSLSTGTPIPSANVVILIDLAFRNFQIEQSISRAYRVGNNEKVTVFLCKLDTGNDLNITDRDLFIVNTSEYNVEMITGTKPVYDIPQQPKAYEEVVPAVEDVIEEELLNEFYNSNGIDFAPLEVVKSFLRKIKII